MNGSRSLTILLSSCQVCRQVPLEAETKTAEIEQSSKSLLLLEGPDESHFYHPQMIIARGVTKVTSGRLFYI